MFDNKAPFTNSKQRLKKTEEKNDGLLSVPTERRPPMQYNTEILVKGGTDVGCVPAEFAPIFPSISGGKGYIGFG